MSGTPLGSSCSVAERRLCLLDEGQTAIVTGSGLHIRRAIALAFHVNGGVFMF